LVASSLPDRLAQRRITRLLEERLPGLTARFRRHGKTLAEIVHAGASAAERLAAIARHRAGKFPDAAAYWRKMAQSASQMPGKIEAKKQTKRRGRRQ